MGTRSLTTFIDDHTKEEIVVMYRQYDGYPEGHGRDLVNFLNGMTVVNGIPGGKRISQLANGVSCLAAQIVSHFKKGVGDFYLHAGNTRDYGEEFVYTYGQLHGLCEFFAYRITRVLPDGTVTELSEQQMRTRASELGISTCPLLAGPVVFLGSQNRLVDKHQIAGAWEYWLEDLVDRYIDGPSLLDDRHPREGIIIRVDTPDGRSYCLKDKNHKFKLMEGIAKDSGEVDIEEAS